MRIGLLADIHGDAGNLSRAIDSIRQRSVDRIIVLGDVIYDTRHADTTVDLLHSCGAVGVWGNHELGLCVDPDDEVRKLYSEKVMRFFGTLQPSIDLGQVLASHTFPTEDPRDVLSYYVGQPEDRQLVAACFAAVRHRIIACGHFHRWFAATPSGRVDWSGECPLRLDPEDRYLIIIDAVMHGYAAVLDDAQNVLTPIHL